MDGCEEVEVVLCGGVCDGDGVCFEDDVGGVGGGVGDGDVGCGVRRELQKERGRDDENDYGDEDGDEEVAAGWLGEGKSGHSVRISVQGLVPVILDCVFFEEYGDECGGGDGDEGSDDAGDGGADEQGDEDGESHEVDAGAHDPRGENGVFDVDVDEVEEEDTGHFGPGVECRDSGRDEDGDDSSSDGNDVEHAHEDAE